MAAARIRNTFRLESEPILFWPSAPARLVRVDGFRLSYSGDGLVYTLLPEKKASVVMVQLEYRKVEWTDVFSVCGKNAVGLHALAQLGEKITEKTLCEWVSRHGLLGFRQQFTSSAEPYHFVPYLVSNRMMYYHSEPFECIRLAAQRAINVMKLWSALKGSYQLEHSGDTVRAIKSVVTVKEDIRDSSQLGTDPINYRVFVNGERRSQRPQPQCSRDWRFLASVLLAEYIHDHISGEVRVELGLRQQNKDSESRREEERPPDWNLSPVLRVESALTAYYVELLMVMRRFRSCNRCGSDISHQKERAIYCSETCRSTMWHRRRAKTVKQAG
jgi:hypothetical protein